MAKPFADYYCMYVDGTRQTQRAGRCRLSWKGRLEEMRFQTVPELFV